ALDRLTPLLSLLARAIPTRPGRASTLASMSPSRVSFCVALNAEAGKAPGCIQLIPAPDAAGKVVGRDGRAWLWDDAARNSVIDTFTSRRLDLAIDRNHSTQLRASEGGESPAAGWISTIEIRDRALWGQVSWTPRGQEEVINREYRFISPVFDFDKTTGRIHRMVTVGLTNTPNLHLPALNHEEPPMSSRSMALIAALTILALQATASDDDLAAAINTLKKKADDLETAKNSQVPSLDQYVPRKDYDVVFTRATNAENSLQQRTAADFKVQVDGAIADALKAGKITPATEPFYRATCADAAGLTEFRKFVAAAPAIGDDSTIGTRKSVPTNLQDAQAISEAALNHQKAERDLGREIDIVQAVHHVTTRGAK
ncbi:MAG TPA: phage protease, partial [Polyangiaceae bacterium]